MACEVTTPEFYQDDMGITEIVKENVRFTDPNGGRCFNLLGHEYRSCCRLLPLRPEENYE